MVVSDHSSMHFVYVPRGLFTLAVGGSAYVVRTQVTEKRKKQAEQGLVLINQTLSLCPQFSPIIEGSTHCCT